MTKEELGIPQIAEEGEGKSWPVWLAKRGWVGIFCVRESHTRFVGARRRLFLYGT